MLFAVLKTVHVLSLIVWIGGMFFTQACLKPSLGVLDGAARLRLMDAVLGRFFAIVLGAVALVLLSGGAMVWGAWRAAAGPGLHFNMPLDWHVMIVLGVVMMLIFGHIRGALFRRLRAAALAQDLSAGAAALERIRRWVTTNLVIGVIVILVVMLGAA
jgi:uncharacterized membrane protein